MSFLSNLLDYDSCTYEYFVYQDFCRLCWSQNPAREIRSKTIETGEEAQCSLLYKIQECLCIDLSEEVLPIYSEKICVDCLTKIESFYTYKTFCQKTNRKLHEILKNHVSDTTVDLQLQPVYPISENFTIKVEKIDELCDLELTKSSSIDDFLDSLQNSENEYTDLEDTQKVVKKRKSSKYKHKRSSTYCNICHINLESRDTFLAHNSEYHGVEKELYKCFGCEKRFKSRKTRLGHEINFCKGTKDGYKCSICLRFLPKRRMYEAHMKDHRENKIAELPDELFKCAKCSLLFKSKEGLKSHMIEHNDEKKNYVCESCGRVFSRQDYLHKHKLTHSGLKQHECPHCGFRTTQRSSLTVHIRKHTGERPYSCDMCPQRCVSSSNLRAHRQRHQGIKQFECKICSKKFGYKISLDEHVASTHELSQTHPCHLCGATYSRMRGLRRHMLAKHGKDKNIQAAGQSRQLGQNEHSVGVSEHCAGLSEHGVRQSGLIAGESGQLGLIEHSVGHDEHTVGNNENNMGHSEHSVSHNEYSELQNEHGVGLNEHSMGQSEHSVVQNEQNVVQNKPNGVKSGLTLGRNADRILVQNDTMIQNELLDDNSLGQNEAMLKKTITVIEDVRNNSEVLFLKLDGKKQAFQLKSGDLVLNS